MFKLKVHFKCTKLASLISRKALYLNKFHAPDRCVWCGAALGQWSGYATGADARKDTPPDAILAANSNGEGGRVWAKRRGGRPECWRKGACFLNGRSSLRTLSDRKDMRNAIKSICVRVRGKGRILTTFSCRLMPHFAQNGDGKKWNQEANKI